MKHHLERLLAQAVAELHRRGALQRNAAGLVQLQRTRNPRHGDFASNLALLLGKAAAADPRKLAADLIGALPASDCVEKVEIAGPGFINFFVSRTAWREVIGEIRAAGTTYGNSAIGRGRAVLVEFVSANPTGPLHVGHGRGAAYGDAVARLLSAAGYRVRREYYINDAGRQMDSLALSVWLR
ncbi:MAG: arginine--tRNA ligase, partial [Gammaproteobacteria bacterium]|nr:arginine--tRNA ligase [Gammaproteobacteria bacterium]